MRRLALLPRLYAVVGGAGVDDAGAGGDGVDGVVVGADVLEALEVSDAPDLERAVPGARVEQRGIVHRGGDGEAGDAVGVLDPEAMVATPHRRLHVAGLAEHPAQVVPGGGQRGDELAKVGVIGGHEGPVKCIQVSWCRLSNGCMVYSGSLDKTIRVWWVPGALQHDNGNE